MAQSLIFRKEKTRFVLFVWSKADTRPLRFEITKDQSIKAAQFGTDRTGSRFALHIITKRADARRTRDLISKYVHKRTNSKGF